MGHQEAYDFWYIISDNIHHETQQEAVQMLYLLK